MSILGFSRSKSLWVLNYFNSCGFMELLPWVGSGYDMERFGILATASARHADVLVVAGYITTKGAKRLKLLYDQMPSPKYVLALRSCPMTGGMYWDAYNTVKKIDEVIPVDVWVAGCPPQTREHRLRDSNDYESNRGRVQRALGDYDKNEELDAKLKTKYENIEATELTPILLEDWDGMPPLRKDFDSRQYVLDTFYGGERE